MKSYGFSARGICWLALCWRCLRGLLCGEALDYNRRMRAYLLSRRWALMYGLALGVLSLLPYILAWQMQGASWEFTGFLIGVEDGNSYIAKMLLGAQGFWLFRPPYSTWQVAPLPVFLFYILLGKLAGGAALHLQLTVLYHLARLVIVVLVVLATYDFVAMFVECERSRRWAVMLATAGAGLGVWGMLAGVAFEGGALCCYSPEAFGFLAAFFLPHVTLGRAILLWLLRAAALQQWRFWQGVLALVLLAGVQPLTLVTFVLVTVLLLGWQWSVCGLKPSEKVVAWVGVALGVGGGYALLLAYHPYARVWGRQSVVTVVAWWHYLWAYAWLWPLAVVGMRQKWRQGERTLLWVGIWALGFPLFAFLPLTNARRLVDGGWVALSIAAAWGCEKFCRRRRWLAYGILAVAWVPALTMLGMMTREALHPALPAFRSVEEAAAFQAVAQYAHSGDGVLAAYQTGNALPAWAPVRVIAGLGPESPDLPQQEANLRRFFALETSDAWRQDFLAANHLRWVFYGPAERALGAWQPDWAGFLCSRYRSDDYALFEVCP